MLTNDQRDVNPSELFGKDSKKRVCNGSGGLIVSMFIKY